MTSHSLPTSLQTRVSLTWAWLLETWEEGRKERRAGGRLAVREEWEWVEVWTVTPAPARRWRREGREKAGWEGEHLTTMS